MPGLSPAPALEWVQPRQHGSENGISGMAIVRREPAGRRTFTLVTSERACVVRASERVAVRSAQAAQEAFVVPMRRCADSNRHVLALEGAHPSSLLIELVEDDAARALLPGDAIGPEDWVSVFRAPSLPYVFLFDRRWRSVRIYAGGALVLERARGASGLLRLEGDHYLVSRSGGPADPIGELVRLPEP